MRNQVTTSATATFEVDSEGNRISEARWTAVIGVDPGGTTGVCSGVFNVALDSMADVVKSAAVQDDPSKPDGGLFFDQLKGSEIKQVMEIMRIVEDVDSMTGEYGSVLAIEDFVLRAHTKSTARAVLSPVRITAMIEWEIERVSDDWAEAVSVINYSPANAKSIATDARLKSVGLYPVGKPHAKDAARQVLMALRSLRS